MRGALNRKILQQLYIDGARYRPPQQRQGRPGEASHQVRTLLMVELLAAKGGLKRSRMHDAKGPYQTATDAVLLAGAACNLACPARAPLVQQDGIKVDEKRSGLYYASPMGARAAAVLVALGGSRAQTAL